MGVYARILRSPGVAPIVAATVIGRLPIGISGLAILLFISEESGSFAVAGICAERLPSAARWARRSRAGSWIAAATAA